MKKTLFLFALLVLVVTGCRNRKEETTVISEQVNLQLTTYSNEFEVFAEAQPFVVGQPSNVLSHFSHLPDFKALQSGRMTIRLIVNGSEVNQLLEKPSRKGIFSFDLKPQTQGTGRIVYDINIDGAEYQVIVPDIVVYSDEESASEAAKSKAASKTNTTVFTKERSWKIDFSTEHPESGSFGQVIKTTGRVESAQGDEQVIVAKTSGIISLPGDNLLEGKSVSKGSTLVIIAGNGLADNNSAVRFAEAQNNFQKAKTDLERAVRLAKDKIVSDKDLLKAQHDFDNASAIYENLRKNFSAAGQSVTSPLTGFIKQLFVRSGQYIEAGQPVAVVSQNKTLVISADVQQKYASILGSIVSANIRTLHDDKTYTLEELNGKVLAYGRAANSDNYLVPMTFQIDNAGSFIPGGFVELYLKTVTGVEVITVPNSAIMEDQGNFFLYVQVHPELFEKRAVRIGASDGIRTEIKAGTSITDRVITRGAILVKLAQATGTLDAHSGHNH
ncbi:MAG: efflux RND transporter periplasmic adaptor subunit [Bacteroidales bacterium]